MKVKKGDRVIVEYTTKLETGEIVETSDKETAKEAKIYEAKKNYEPIVVKVGAGQVIKGFEEALLDMEKGEEKETTVPPEKAYGEEKQNKVENVPKRAFLDVGIVPKKGEVVRTHDGVLARIADISGDSVKLNFNHPLAGETLVFDIKILDIQQR